MEESKTPTATRTALLVIDMQRYFVQREYPFGRLMKLYAPDQIEAYLNRVERSVIPNIQRLQERFRSLGSCIAYTEFGSLRKDGLDMPRWARKINDLGHQSVGAALFPPFEDPSCRVDDAVAPRPDELVVRKNTSGPVASTKLDHVLKVLGIDTVVVTGVVTDICVAQTTREFGDRDFNAIVVEDACAAFDETRHKAALETIGTSFGAVASTSDVLELLQK